MPAFKNNYVDNTVGKYNIFSFHPLLVPKTKFQTGRKKGTTSLYAGKYALHMLNFLLIPG